MKALGELGRLGVRQNPMLDEGEVHVLLDVLLLAAQGEHARDAEALGEPHFEVDVRAPAGQVRHEDGAGPDAGADVVRDPLRAGVLGDGRRLEADRLQCGAVRRLEEGRAVVRGQRDEGGRARASRPWS